MDRSRQTPLSTEFSGQEYWSGLPFFSPGALCDSGIEPKSPALQVDSLPSEAPGEGEGEASRGTEEPRQEAEIQGESGGMEAQASPASPSSQAPVLRTLRASRLRGFKQMAAGKFRGPGEAGQGEKGSREHSCRHVLIFFPGGSSEGERRDRKLTAVTARGMEVRSKEELPDCEGLGGGGGERSLEPGGWRDIKAWQRGSLPSLDVCPAGGPRAVKVGRGEGAGRLQGWMKRVHTRVSLSQSVS